MLTLELMRRHRPWAHPVALHTVHGLWRLLCLRHGVRVIVEGAERLPQTPAVVATNATHKYDLVPIRAALKECGHQATTVSKGKNWHDRASAFACDALGSLPLVSKGYILTMDFMAVIGRRPQEDEYAALRAHIDHGVALPPTEVFKRLSTTPRQILGGEFNPRVVGYRAAVLALYHTFQMHMLRLGRQAIARGVHIHIFPQGSVSTRLSTGRIGAVQIASALGLPIVPISVSGAQAVFANPGKMQLRSGTLMIRIGEPFMPDVSDLPRTFRPFHPEDEREFKPILQRSTDTLMEAINQRLDVQNQWSPERRSDGAQGTHRFA